MSENESKKLDTLIKTYEDTIKQLEEAKGKDAESQSATINAALNAHVCCNACQAMSSFCVPDKTPSKCQGGCTVTSFAF